MSELVKREIQFNAVQDRGESLVLQHHPASKCIETYMSAMQTQWAWLLQLTICLETHLKHVATYQQYFSDIKECEQTIARKEEMLNTVFSKSDFSLDEGELLLKEMQELREDLTKYGEVIQSLSNQSREIIPLKQRKMNINHPITVTAICNYKQNNVNWNMFIVIYIVFLKEQGFNWKYHVIFSNKWWSTRMSGVHFATTANAWGGA